VYSSPNIIQAVKSKKNRWTGHVARMGESIRAYSVFVGKPLRQRPLVARDHRGKDNIKMEIIEGGGRGSTSGQAQVIGCCEHGGEPLGSVKCGELIDWLRNC